MNELDRQFSRYIRLKYAWGDNPKFVKCFTCGKVMKLIEDGKWNGNVHAGHFIDRRHKATRWIELNVHPQCVSCNKWKEGNKYEYGKRLNKKYGAETTERLEILSRRTLKIGKFEMKELTKFYRKKVKDALQRKTY